MKKAGLIAFLNLIFLAGSVSAQYYGSPINFLLNSEWIRFLLIFVIFFAVIYIATYRAFKENKGVAVVIAIAISLLISFTMAQRGLIYGYVGDEIGSWLLVIAILLALAFLIRLVYVNLGRWVILLLVILYGIMWFIDPYELLPVSGTGAEVFIAVYNFLISIWGLILFVIAMIIIAAIKSKKKGFLISPH